MAATFSPSIKLEHADARGEIYSIDLPDGRELMLLHSLPGAMRGGHSHNCDELVVVLSGKMRYYKRSFDGQEEIQQLRGGNSSYNLAGEIHMGEFLTDTWLTEYKFAKKGEWKQVNYAPWREKVLANGRGVL